LQLAAATPLATAPLRIRFSDHEPPGNTALAWLTQAFMLAVSLVAIAAWLALADATAVHIAAASDGSVPEAALK